MILRFLAASVAAMTALVAAAVPAQAATPGLKCDTYWNTPYGPVAQCTQDMGGTGRVGFHSALTHAFNAQTGYMAFASGGRNWYGHPSVRATDGVVGQVYGYGMFSTGFGPAVYADQVRKDGMGRWGVWNYYTNEFHPSSGWMTWCCRAN
jgi:hypothetical protein